MVADYHSHLDLVGSLLQRHRRRKDASVVAAVHQNSADLAPLGKAVPEVEDLPSVEPTAGPGRVPVLLLLAVLQARPRNPERVGRPDFL